jgi:hypothetical protein
MNAANTAQPDLARPKILLPGATAARAGWS